MNTLLTRQEDGVHTLSLNRPDRLNALTAELGRELWVALDVVEADPACRAVLLMGEGRGFCAGQDLASVTPATDLGDTLEQSLNPLIRRLRALPVPIVCAVQGVAAGAGANIALACDIVLAGVGARFIQAFVNIGLVPDAGGSYVLPRLVGDARARGLAMLGEPITGQQAAEWGLIWCAVPDEQLLPEAQRVAAKLASLPTQALALMKRAFAQSGGNTLDQQLDVERDLQRLAGRTPDYREGVAAFLAKRPAVFTGLK